MNPTNTFYFYILKFNQVWKKDWAYPKQIIIITVRLYKMYLQFFRVYIL